MTLLGEGGEAAAAARSAIDEVWSRTRGAALEGVATIESGLLALRCGALDVEARSEVERAAHRLAGSAGTFGFARASEAARRLEMTIAGNGPVPAAALDAAIEDLVVLRASLEGDPDSAALTEPSSKADINAVRPSLVLAIADELRCTEISAAAAARGFRTVAVPAGGGLPREPLAAAVIDLGLADGAGFRLLAELEAAQPSTPAFTLTPRDTFTDRVEAARAGARGFFNADLPADELLDAISALLERDKTRTTVLAVDDDPTVLAALEAVLGASGIEVVAVERPQEFWSALEDHGPDLVILDLGMPAVSGDDLCRMVRSDPDWSGVPVLFLTRSTDPATISAVFAAGADDFVAKPFVGPELLGRINNRLERTRLLRTFAETDPLTGVANRRGSDGAIERMLDLARRHQEQVSLAVLDLDAFKQLNDRHGHAVGDAVLRRLGALLTTTFHGEDVKARWGGEEFVVAMYGMGRDDGIQRVACTLEAFRAERFPTPSGGEVSVTFSAGVALYPDDADTVNKLYEAADGALYRAKRQGRDQVLPATVRAPGQDCDVVLVEDDETVVDLLADALRTRGYRVRHVSDGAEAVARLVAEPAELHARLVLLDIDLPGLDGLEVLRRMAAAGTLSRTRVIMLTACSSDQAVLEALELGAFDHVTKPFSVPVLLQRIRRALAH